MSELIVGLVAAAGGVAAGLFAERAVRGRHYKTRDDIIEAARREAETLQRDQELRLKEELLTQRESLEARLEESHTKLRDRERELDRRSAQMDEQQDAFRKKEKMLQTTQQKLTDRTRSIDAREAELNRMIREEQDQLYRISELSKEQATEKLLKRLDRDLADQTGALIMKHETELRTECERRAREIIGMAVQRYASAHTSETTTSTVDIPNDDVKGRIIGREGRNIRAFEKATGVDVIVDDTPGVVIVSAFDNVRREIGKRTLVKLIQDGRIHPSRIEEIVAETTREMDEHIRRLGLQASEEAGIRGLHPKILDLMGRLHFRVSYSQNVRQHSIEVAHLTGLMAEQLGLDGNLARRCGFLHDIGKAADHEMEGGHPAVGAELLKRYSEGAEVVHAAAGHHDDIRPEFIYTVLVAAADAVSAARPGARRETLEKYVRRLEELEALVCGFPGVEQAFAIQAGREVRVIVDSARVNDRQAARMSRDIASAIEQTLTYPGEIKVTVLRETRNVEYAR